MSKENSLEKYTMAVNAIEAHKEAHQAVFKEHERLLMNLIDTENELRDEVATDGSGVENSQFKVVVIPQTQRVYDEDKLHQLLNATQFASVVNDVQRSPRISIKPIK